METVLNGNIEQMENAVYRLRDNLKKSKNSYGFFFYAGHGVQSNGENFLIPVDANIPNENRLKNNAVSVQSLLDDLNDAGNALNVVVLDACRDNPFGWSRGGTRGLAMMASQPADSIIVYATSAGQKASDGDGRNGLFTSQLLHNLASPGIDVNEVFKRTGADVSEASGRQQIPAIYNQYFGTAFLGKIPDGYLPGNPAHDTTVIIGRGKRKTDPAKFWSVGASVGSCFIDPYVAAAVRGTIAPFKYSFLNLGMEIGFVSGAGDVKKYISFYPFAHYAIFLPFNEKAAFYAGAGGGFMRANYTFEKEGATSANTGAMDIIGGFYLFKFLDVSYSLRTNYKATVSKVAVGYGYRF